MRDQRIPSRFNSENELRMCNDGLVPTLRYDSVKFDLFIAFLARCLAALRSPWSEVKDQGVRNADGSRQRNGRRAVCGHSEALQGWPAGASSVLFASFAEESSDSYHWVIRLIPTRGTFREDDASLLVSPRSRTTGRPVQPQA
jgi:hypothetical protein